MKDEEIKERWRGYFCKLLNINHESNIALEVINFKTSDIITYIKNIRVGETKDVLRKMKVRKNVGPDGSPIELQKPLGDENISRLTKLYNRYYVLGNCHTNGVSVR